MIRMFVVLGLLLAAFSPAFADPPMKEETGIADAVTQYGLTGEGVIVGILDRGIDWKNNDFRNTDGTTRIAYIFDLTNDAGANAPGNTYGRGTISPRAQIDAALTSGVDIPFRDAVGHGTTTAGLCCSNGRNSANAMYAGVAPKATLIVVKIVAGAAAHGAIPAEPAFFQGARVPVGMRFIRDKAAELGMPVVMLPNIGSTTGPADGFSADAIVVDDLTGPGRPGVVYVQGTSDDGDMANHASGAVTQGDTATIQIQKGSANGTSLLFDLWYGEDDRFAVSIVTPSGVNGPYAPPANNTGTTASGAGFQMGHNGSIFFSNFRRQIYAFLSGPPGTYEVRLTGTAIQGGGQFHAALNPSRYWDASAADNRFLSHVTPGHTITDMATAFSAIVPNSYVLRTSITDIDGIVRTFPATEGAIGDLWRGSGIGPTWDGRLGMDISAPGERLIATYAPESVYGTARFNMVQDGGGFYGVQSAVSAANPVVTGVVALMLQMNPTLDASTVKSILQRSARKDSFTGATANTTWGHGKLDAKAALDLVAAEIPTTGVVSAVLPYGRSVTVGTAATAFGLMINAGVQTAQNCRPMLPPDAPPAAFTYQTTTPANALSGTPNTPANIAPGAIQNFVFGITPARAFSNREIRVLFDCDNTQSASSTKGVNTFILSAAASAGPDIVAIGATLSGDGIVNVPGNTGTGLLAAAAVNIGTSTGMRVTADTGERSLPLSIKVCRTNPGTGACLAPPADFVDYTATQNATDTFSVFAQGSGAIPFDPANNRIFLRFKTTNGVTRGATNAAIRTQ